jgi:hypothetical protein
VALRLPPTAAATAATATATATAAATTAATTTAAAATAAATALLLLFPALAVRRHGAGATSCEHSAASERAHSGGRRSQALVEVQRTGFRGWPAASAFFVPLTVPRSGRTATMKLSVVLLAAACASCTGITVAPERPKARLERSSAVLALRGGEGGALTLPKLALGANIATWGFYGANLWVQPNFVLQQIMMAPSAMDFLAPNYAVAQYLGAFYLSQALP